MDARIEAMPRSPWRVGRRTAWVSAACAVLFAAGALTALASASGRASSEPDRVRPASAFDATYPRMSLPPAVTGTGPGLVVVANAYRGVPGLPVTGTGPGLVMVGNLSRQGRGFVPGGAVPAQAPTAPTGIALDWTRFLALSGLVALVVLAGLTTLNIAVRRRRRYPVASGSW